MPKENLTKEAKERLLRLSSNPMLIKFCDHYRFNMRATIIEQCAMSQSTMTTSLNKDLVSPPLEQQMFELAQFFFELSEHARMVAEDIEVRLIAREYSPRTQHFRDKKILTDTVRPPSDLEDLAMFEASLQRCKFMCLEPDKGVFNSLVNGLLMVKHNWNRGRPVEILKASEAIKYVTPHKDKWIHDKHTKHQKRGSKAIIGTNFQAYRQAAVAKPRNSRSST